MALNWVDAVIVGIVSLSVVTGLFRGFIKELISLCVWILAFWLAYHYAKEMSVFLPTAVSDPNVRNVLASICVLVAVLIVGGIFNALLGVVVTRSGLSSTDRVLGLGFGFIRGVLIVAIIILGAKIMALPTVDQREQSLFYTKFEPLVHWMEGYLPDFIKRMNAFQAEHQQGETPTSERQTQDEEQSEVPSVDDFRDFKE